MKLSKHFELWEFTVSQTATRLGLKNQPGKKALTNIKRLVRRLEIIRAILEAVVIISSGYRSPKVNAAVGGSPRSQHMQGLAADFNVPGYTVEQLISIIKSSGIKYDQLINEFDSWVHISIPPKGSKPRMQSFKIG